MVDLAEILAVVALACRARAQVEITGIDLLLVAQGEGTFQCVFQFAYVAGKAVALQAVHGAVGQARRGHTVALGQTRKNMADQ